MPRIKLITEIKAEKQRVFDLSRSIDLHQISTVHTDESAIAGRTSGLIEEGEFVTWRARHFGIYQTMTSQITEFQNSSHFVDVMVKGIFASFSHVHRFESKSNKRTLMIDVLDYRSPLGLLGQIADRLFVRSYLKRLLLRRNRTIKEYAETDMWKAVLPLKNMDYPWVTNDMAPRKGETSPSSKADRK